MLPIRAIVDLTAMAMKGCSAFPKAPANWAIHKVKYQNSFISDNSV